MALPATMPQQVTANRPSVADHVFEELRRQVLSLELPPGARISEVEVARSMDVSRQPVRDAFYRLSKLGFLTIRPQRATTVSLISPAAVMQARFIRTALEVETVTHAATALSTADLDVLEGILDQQRQVVDPEHRAAFHRLDDLFHYEICARAELGFVWETVAENKGHMDRVRMLSLTFATERAFQDHLRIFEALKARDPDRAVATMRDHLSRIATMIDRIRDENRDWFIDA
ncbi:MAG: GntR family transcriptional regulator [Maritimibacter sp.]|nr:GntR family transcriptional regulator [Maritimibacter sp.]